VNESGFVLFRLGERTFATALDDVREIVRLRGLQRLPAARPPLAGMILLRETPLPVLDVRRSDAGPGPDPGGCESASCESPSCESGDVLVVAGAGGVVGVAVDTVAAVLPPEQLPPCAALPSTALPDYVIGIRTGADGPVLEVDLRKLLDATAAGWHDTLEGAASH